MMKALFLLLTAAFLLPAAAGGQELSTAEFMKIVRNPASSGTYSKLTGIIQHRRRGGSVERNTLYFGIIIQSDRFTGQLVIDDRDFLLISQSRKSGVSAVTPLKGNTAVLDRVGLRATDLTMGFLHGRVIRELERESLRMASCRVMLLESPDKKEEVKIWIAAAHYFPLKAEFRKKGAKAAYRTLECNGFTKKNDLYYARELDVTGPGWRTRVVFDPDKAELGFYDPAKPVNIMRPLPGGKK